MPSWKSDAAVNCLSVVGEEGTAVHVWWSPEGVSIATDLGPDSPGTLVHLSHAAAAYLGGVLAIASGVITDAAEMPAEPVLRGDKLAGCTCGLPPFAPPEPDAGCPHHGRRG
jgi:hypothetical protein